MNDGNLQTDLSVTAEIKLYYDLFIPEGAENAQLLIAVHGYGAHKRYMMREARLVAPADCVIASIQAPHQHYRQSGDGYRVGFGWLTDHRPDESIRIHHDLILSITDRLAADGCIDPSRIFLYGFSQACALNFRFAFTYPELPAGVIGVCGGIPGDLETNQEYEPFPARTLYLYGDDDEFYSQEKFEENAARLNTMLPNVHSRRYRAGHEITDDMRSDIKAFLAAA